jgi:AcrR family transcriptional regulator
VLSATRALLEERGFDGVELPEIARRSGVHPTTVYRRWATKDRLVGEALLEQSRPLGPTPDTGTLRGDLEHLLAQGAELIRTPPVRALFEVLLAQWAQPTSEIEVAREQFWTAHLAEVKLVVERAVARSELPAAADPLSLVELVIGPALVHMLLMGGHLEPADRRQIVSRALGALSAPASRDSAWLSRRRLSSRTPRPSASGSD